MPYIYMRFKCIQSICNKILVWTRHIILYQHLPLLPPSNTLLHYDKRWHIMGEMPEGPMSFRGSQSKSDSTSHDSTTWTSVPGAWMKIVIDKYLENTVWQWFWRVFNEVFELYAYLWHLESYYCILRWIKCIRLVRGSFKKIKICLSFFHECRAAPVGAWARSPGVGRALQTNAYVIKDCSVKTRWQQAFVAIFR
jgi:hypothetical protein